MHKKLNNPRWVGWTRDLSIAPDIGKDGYYWERHQDQFGEYWIPVKIRERLKKTKII